MLDVYGPKLNHVSMLISAFSSRKLTNIALIRHEIIKLLSKLGIIWLKYFNYQDNRQGLSNAITRASEPSGTTGIKGVPLS